MVGDVAVDFPLHLRTLLAGVPLLLDAGDRKSTSVLQKLLVSYDDIIMSYMISYDVIFCQSDVIILEIRSKHYPDQLDVPQRHCHKSSAPLSRVPAQSHPAS